MSSTASSTTTTTPALAAVAASTSSTDPKFVHNFNDQSQYNDGVISTFESTFGADYMSAGGLDTTRETIRLFLEPTLLRHTTKQHHQHDQPPPCRVLDIGCGIGGVALHLSQHYGAHVTGVDVNEAGLERARATATAKGVDHLCVFAASDVTRLDYPAHSFDIIYSRDVLLHIDAAAKARLFPQLFRWLAPGGHVCVTDYCLGADKAVPSPDFQTYLDTRGYHLHTPQGYGQLFVEAGFDPDMVEVQDRPLWYCATSQGEIDKVARPGPTRDAFVQQHSWEALEKLERVYRDKISMTLRGDRSYVFVHAVKEENSEQLEPWNDLRQPVVDAYQTMSRTGLILSCDGNVSARATPDTFLVTPSGVDVADLTADQVVRCTLDGCSVPDDPSGLRPSSETNLHAGIYAARDDVHAIVHSHSIYVCALACCRVPLPPAHYAVCELLSSRDPMDFSASEGGSTADAVAAATAAATVPCTTYHAYGSRPLAAACVQALGPHHAVLLANHGAVVTGPDVATALYHAERLERECEIYWRAVQLSAGLNSQMNSMTTNGGSNGASSSKAMVRPETLTLEEMRALQVSDAAYGQSPETTVEEAAL